MAIPIRWLRQAEQELEAIWLYISQDSPQNAADVIVKLTQAARDLGADPKIGHVVPEFEREDIREYPVWPFRLIYRVSEADITILAIVHGAQVMPGHIASR